jgi:regulator of nucleoside diphosphate kinase
MSPSPAIAISSLDLERLTRLLDAKAYNRLPGIDALASELDRASVVEPTEVPPEVVTMNSTVRFADVACGREYQLTLVYPHEAGAPGTVSILAPVGSALLGLSVGQAIAWQIPGGRELQLRVLEVLRQPEAMGEFHR